MKKLIHKTISIYLHASIFYLLKADAQIVYHDVVPDVSYTITTYASQSYNLDLNGDGTTDFVINALRAHGGGQFQLPVISSVKITPQGNNAFATTALNTVKKLNQFDLVDTTLSWHSGGAQVLKYYIVGGSTYSSGEWDSIVNGFAGLKLIVGGQTYYGWVRMNVNVSLPSASMTIKDYAYNSIPNQPILAGQTTTTGITENISSNHFSVFSFNKTLNIELNGATPLNGNITICNTLGQELKNIKIENSTMQIDMSDCNRGIYFVSVQTNEAIETKKIYLK